MTDDFDELIELMQDQMRDVSALQAKRSALVAKVTAADGAVEVKVDARGAVTDVVIEETYLNDFELAELGGHIVDAARKATTEVGRQTARLLEPLSQRRKAMRSMSEIAQDLPDFAEVLSLINPPTDTPDAAEARADGDGPDGSSYPKVRNS